MPREDARGPAEEGDPWRVSCFELSFATGATEKTKVAQSNADSQTTPQTLTISVTFSPGLAERVVQVTPVARNPKALGQSQTHISALPGSDSNRYH